LARRPAQAKPAGAGRSVGLESLSPPPSFLEDARKETGPSLRLFGLENVQGDFRHRGVERGNFFDHGRRFGFRRFWHGQWVFLNGWDDCTAFVWVHVAPGVWAWRPIDVCIG